MNRDIMFRAKRRYGFRAWVKGDLIRDRDLKKACISGFDYYSSEHGMQREAFTYEVDIRTICRYTGLDDKDGKKIWENDIISYEDAIGVIRHGEFNSKYIGFYIEWQGKCHDLRNDPLFWIPKVKIIGNIFDNPELLQVSAHD